MGIASTRRRTCCVRSFLSLSLSPLASSSFSSFLVFVFVGIGVGMGGFVPPPLCHTAHTASCAYFPPLSLHDTFSRTHPSLFVLLTLPRFCGILWILCLHSPPFSYFFGFFVGSFSLYPSRQLVILLLTNTSFPFPDTSTNNDKPPLSTSKHIFFVPILLPSPFSLPPFLASSFSFSCESPHTLFPSIVYLISYSTIVYVLTPWPTALPRPLTILLSHHPLLSSSFQTQIQIQIRWP